MDASLPVKERIKRAAIERFVRHGIAETSIREIATAAGVSLGAMYNHYKSKDELATELFSTLFAGIADDLSAVAETGTSLGDKFRRMVGLIYQRVELDPMSIGFLFLSRQQLSRAIRPGTHNPFQVFRRVISGAMERGEIPRRDPIFATSIVVGAINQVVDTKLLGASDIDLTTQVDAVTDACLAFLGAHGPEAARRPRGPAA
jgi:AcrR family transcriptional regulator